MIIQCAMNELAFSDADITDGCTVALQKGGGLCYFEDKNSKAYGNLLNCHDTGRLVQQSCYGPMDMEGYENGVYGDARWCYNPAGRRYVRQRQQACRD
ncbi:MAG: hypothetical protein IKD72_09720 [Clostridia bacterium]|nr:hypothetical protein [Clostridia bacterium]